MKDDARGCEKGTANCCGGGLTEMLRAGCDVPRALWNALPSPLFVKDIDGRYLGCNAAFERFVGRRQDEIVGQTVREAWPRALADEYRRMDLELLERGGTQQYEGRAPGADGSLRDVLFTKTVFEDADGRTAGIVGSLTDITERKRSEASARRLATAVAQAAESVMITDALGTIEYVNPFFTELTGYSVEEAMGMNPRVLKSGRQDDAFYRRMWETITAGRVWRGRMVNKRKDGSLYTEDCTISPVWDEAASMPRKRTLPSPAPENIPFKIHPRAFAALGADLVTNDVVAVVELVKNSYDAWATDVTVRFGENAGKKHLEVLDNGVGMSKAVLSDVWCVVATPFKQTTPHAKLGGKVRRVTGEKGLGRLSVARLGERLRMGIGVCPVIS